MSSLYRKRKRGPQFIAACIFDVIKMCSHEDMAGMLVSLRLEAEVKSCWSHDLECLSGKVETAFSERWKGVNRYGKERRSDGRVRTTPTASLHLKPKVSKIFQVDAPDSQGRSLLCARSS